MAPRFRVSGVIGHERAIYSIADSVSGDGAGTVEIGDLTATLILRDAQGGELLRQPVSLNGLDPLSFQKALRRFLAEARPGEDYLFEEVPSGDLSMAAGLLIEGDLDDADLDDEDDEDDEED